MSGVVLQNSFVVDPPHRPADNLLRLARTTAVSNSPPLKKSRLSDRSSVSTKVVANPDEVELSPLRDPSRDAIPPAPTFWRSPGLAIDTKALPPCLEIYSTRLNTQSRTHLSYHLNGSKHQRLSKEETYTTGCFRPLEWYGDAELKHYVATILFVNYPGLTHANYTLLVAMLIQNDTISYIAWAYGLGERMRYGKVAHGDQSLKHHQDTLANLFEAMLGGLIMDRRDGKEPEVKEWMQKVFSDKVFPGLRAKVEDMKKTPFFVKVPPPIKMAADEDF